MRSLTENTNPAKSKTGFKSSLTGLILLLVSIVCYTGCGAGPPDEATPVDPLSVQPQKVVGIGRVEPEKRFLDLRPETSGLVTEIFFKPGDTIRRGEALLRMSDDVESTRVAQAESRIATQRSQQKAAAAALGAVRIRAENARLQFERTKTLLEQDAEARAAFDRIKADYETLLEEIKQRQADVETAASLIRQYGVDRDLAGAERMKKTLRAADNGVLLALDISPGAFISPEQTVGRFAPEGPRIVRAEIDELFADRIETEMKAHIRRQGETVVLSEGKVIFVGPFFKKKSLFSDDVSDLEDRRVREVWISLESPENLIFGMRVECVIFLEKI